jgi:hypothetical protein
VPPKCSPYLQNQAYRTIPLTDTGHSLSEPNLFHLSKLDVVAAAAAAAAVAFVDNNVVAVGDFEDEMIEGLMRRKNVPDTEG